jgi:ADP-ribose pyrophosphatase
MIMWQTLKSETVYQGWLTVVRDRVVTPAGAEADWTYVAANGAAAVLAFTGEGQVVLTRQYRHPLRRTILDLPAGGIRPGETPEQAAHRELAEETGFTTPELHLLGQFYPAPGLMAQTVYVFVTHDLVKGTPALDEHELIDTVLMDWAELVAQVVAGEAVDVTLAYAVLLYRQRV